MKRITPEERVRAVFERWGGADDYPNYFPNSDVLIELLSQSIKEAEVDAIRLRAAADAAHHGIGSIQIMEDGSVKRIAPADLFAEPEGKRR